jgi:hypothetical protein
LTPLELLNFSLEAGDLSLSLSFDKLGLSFRLDLLLTHKLSRGLELSDLILDLAIAFSLLLVSTSEDLSLFGHQSLSKGQSISGLNDGGLLDLGSLNNGRRHDSRSGSLSLKLEILRTPVSPSLIDPGGSVEALSLGIMQAVRKIQAILSVATAKL